MGKEEKEHKSGDKPTYGQMNPIYNYVGSEGDHNTRELVDGLIEAAKAISEKIRR